MGKFSTFGRVGKVASKADEAVGGLLRGLDPQDAARMVQSGNYPASEIQRAIATPGYKPRPWSIGGKNELLSTGSNGNYIPTEQFAEATQSLRNEPGLTGIENRMHRVIEDEQTALNALAEVKAKFEAKAQGFDAQKAQLEVQYAQWKKDGSTPLLRKDGRPASNQKDSFETAIDAARRLSNDWRTTAPEPVVAEWLDEMAKSGYGAAIDKPGGAISGQTKKSKKNPLGMTLDEIIEQHHGFPNQEAADMMKQTAFVNEVFKLNAWQYIAKQYKTGLGKARANMGNIPASVHRGEKIGLHAWLTQMGFNDYWKTLLKENPNMTQQQIMNAIDIYFEDVFYPSLIQVENLVLKFPKKHNWKGMHLPKEVLKDAKRRLKELEESIRAEEALKYDDVRNLDGYGSQVERTALDRSGAKIAGVGSEVLEENLDLTSRMESPFAS